MSNKTFTRKNVTGYVMSCPKGAYRSVEAWLEAKAPGNSMVHDTSTQLTALGIPIVDARRVDGVYYNTRVKAPDEVKITLPSAPSKSKVLDLKEHTPHHFPGMIFFNKDTHRPTNIGTSAPSKISKGTK